MTTPLLLDEASRTYLELPQDLTVAWIVTIDLPPGPVVISAGDVRTACPVAVMALADRLAGRHVGFLGLDLDMLGSALLQQTAIYSHGAAA